MIIQKDGHGHPYIEWAQAPVPGGRKRAWIEHRAGTDADWAKTDRYLNVVHVDVAGHPGDNATDFPVHSDLPDEQILIAFAQSVCAITGCRL